MDPVRVLPEAEDVEGALLSPSSGLWSWLAGEGMYEMLERLLAAASPLLSLCWTRWMRRVANRG